MKYIRIMTAIVGLLIVSGTMASAEDDSRKLGATLFTPRLHGDHFVCSAINVSDRTLGINLAILDDTGLAGLAHEFLWEHGRAPFVRRASPHRKTAATTASIAYPCGAG